MKKSQLKGLKQLAQQLPKSMELQKFTAIKKGYELTIEEITAAKIQIEAETDYVQKGNYRIVEVDHYNRLKKAFARSKEQGLIDYIEWVDRNNRKMNEMFQKMHLETVSQDIMGIAQKGAKGFWQNLLNFFLAFIAIFQTKK